MSIKSILKNHEIFEYGIKEIIKYGLDIISSKLPKRKETQILREKSILIESLFLRSCALWENFIEKEIVYLINQDTTIFLKYFGLPKNTNLNLRLIKAMLYGDRYQDFHDIERMTKYFKNTLTSKFNLFFKITRQQKTKVSFTFKIRNYLSHYSEYSRKILLKAYENDYKYKIFLEPGRFLIKEKGKHFENLIHNFILISARMKSTLPKD